MSGRDFFDKGPTEQQLEELRKKAEQIAMTQPNKPGPSWEKELLTAAVDNFKEENPHLANDEYYHKADKSMTIRSFMKGARWAQEKGVMEMSPEESKKHNDAMLSFFGDEKAAVIATREGVGQYSVQGPFSGAPKMAAAPGEEFFLNALAIMSEAMPTPVEGYKQNPSFLLSDLRRLVSEAASLRAENAYLKAQLEIADGNCEDAERNWEESVDDFHELQDVEKALRAQLADAIKILEQYQPVLRRFGCSPKGDHDDPTWCDEGCGDYGKKLRKFLAKLKAGRKNE